MSAISSAATVQSAGNPFLRDSERRVPERHPCTLEATSHPFEIGDTLSWGAVVHDISAGGVNITLCYPFRPGTFLTVELQGHDGLARSLMVRVKHVHDQKDGMWRLGCEFVNPLTDSDMELFI